MGRLREKILPSLRAALEKLEENAETIPHEDSPHYLPRWDFSQSQDKLTIVLYTKNPDPTFSYCEELQGGGFVIMVCFGWYKRIVSLTIPDFYEPVDVETGLMNMTPNKVEVSFKKSRACEITWPQLHDSHIPKMAQVGIMNPTPPRPKEAFKPIKGLQPQPKAQILKTKEELLLEELRRQKAKPEDDEGEVEEKVITVDDCIPEENIGKNVKRGQTNEAELVTNNKTGGLFDPTKANVAEMDTDEEEELVRKELARLPADMRSRVKVVLKKGEDEEDSDLEGIEQVDWVESANAKELLGQTKFISDKHQKVLEL